MGETNWLVQGVQNPTYLLVEYSDNKHVLHYMFC